MVEKFIKETVENYVNSKSWRIAENANARWSYSGLQSFIAGAVLSDYALNNVYTPEIKEAHKAHSIHIHDLDGGGKIFYCLGHSLKQLLIKGFCGVPGKVSAKPAKHFDSVLGQIVNYIGTLQNEASGAQAFSSFDTYLCPFIRYDNLNPEQVKQALQEFIFSINQSCRWGNQVPFFNITLDLKCPEPLKDKFVIIGGKEQKEKYVDFQKEQDLFNKALIDLFIEGDSDGRPFTFPLPTINLTKDFDWEGEIAQKIFFMTGKYGTPTFQNFINSDMKPEDTYSMCCRLRLDKKLLEKKTGGLFGAGEMTGSIGVVTINMPQLGFKTKGSEEKFFIELDRLMDISSKSLEIKRKEIEYSLKIALTPYTREYLGTTRNHFSTIGLNGMHECCLNFLGKDKGIDTKEGKDFTLKVLDFMRGKLVVYQEKTGNLYNLEATPAEGTSHRFARYDIEKFPDIITAGTKTTPYYTNSTQLPVDKVIDVFDALTQQDELQCKYTGGTVFHAFIGERLHDWRTTRNLVKKIAENFKLPYFTISPTFTICKEHGYISGEHFKCPIDKCEQPTEVYSRIVGYYRPVQQWNKGKKAEFRERNEFKIEQVDI